VKPLLNKIESGFGSSFAIKKIDCASDHPAPEWHQHPEFELVYLSKGVKGRRHIGHHYACFDDGDLTFLGSDLPHYGYFKKGKPGQHKIVVQLRPDFLGEVFFSQPEMAAIRGLFERAKGGITFSGSIRAQIGAHLEQILELDKFDRLIELLRMFNDLAKANDYELLKADGFAIEVDPLKKERIRKIYSYTEENFQNNIPLEVIATKVNMTIPAFCRYIKKLTGKTFTQFVNEFRIDYASHLLVEESMTIAEISFESGFNNFSHFNKQFKAIRNQSPSVFRKQQRQVGG